MSTPWTVLLGHDAAGDPVERDLSQAPHILLCGTSGSGKSVGIEALLAGLVGSGTPADSRITILDPKRVQFGLWRGAPHVAAVVTDRGKMLDALKSMTEEMDQRYQMMERRGVADISELSGTGRSLPRLFLVCDELADLTMAGRTKESKLFAANTLGCLTRIAQLGRAAGVHLIVATQRPAADTLPGNLRANLGTRWAFRVRTRAESRIALDGPGAESLDSAPGTSLLSWRGAQGVFVQGLYVSRQDVVALVAGLGAGRRGGPAMGQWDVHTVKQWVGAGVAGVTGVVVLVGMVREGR